jgi:hypothetical protein
MGRCRSLQSQAVPIATGTIVDATIIHAGDPVHGS